MDPQHAAPSPELLQAFEQSLVASVRYVPGDPPTLVTLDRLGEAAQAPGLLWVGLKDPAAALVQDIAARLGLPQRAIDDMLESHRRPKILEYERLTLVVAIPIEVVHAHPAYGETLILIGPGYLLTIRRRVSADYRALRRDLEETGDVLGRGSDYVASALLDRLADHYVQALDAVEVQVEAIEHHFLLRGFREKEVRHLYRLRRDLLRMQTAMSPLVEICRRLARVDMQNVDMASRGYFGEVADRVQRVVEGLSGLREALAFAFEASMMISQMQQTDITRKLAAWAAILAVPTAVAGIYGMNFKDMPELSWAYGYPAMLLGTFGVCAVLYWKFRRIKWL